MVPDLNLSRWNASACSLPTHVYVICGNSDQEGYDSHDTIERLKVADLSSLGAQWMLIRVPKNLARSYGCSIGLNSSEILIIGGIYWCYDHLNDVVVFNIESEEFKQVGTLEEGCVLPHEFVQGARVSSSKVVLFQSMLDSILKVAQGAADQEAL